MAVAFCVYIIRMIQNKAVVFPVARVIPIILVCMIPFAWIWITSSHAAWCYWYTYRGIAVAVFGGFSILTVISEEKQEGVQ